MPQNGEITLRKVQGGDRETFRALVDQHARAVFRLAYRMTGNETDAEDMVQETFLKAWKQVGKFDGRASFGTWLHRICTNCSLDNLRSRQRRHEAQPGGIEGEAVPNMVATLPATSPSPERLAMSAQVSALLSPALGELTEMERAAFILRHYEGMGIEEISVALGVQPGAAKHSVFRAVRKLRRVLEPAMTMSTK